MSFTWNDLAIYNYSKNVLGASEVGIMHWYKITVLTTMKPHLSNIESRDMTNNKSILCLFVMIAISGTSGQFFNVFNNLFRPLSTLFRGGDDGGTPRPQATGNDELFPTDCGRNHKTGRGKLCFPDGKLCETRVSRSGNINYGGHLYWVSWLSTDPQLRNTNWDWFNARNYCRKRCMDLVSFETREEYEFIKSQMGGVKYFWTSGRLCDFDGCDRPDFFPKQINGWFWSANQARLSPTNSTTAFHDWSFTGGFNPPRRQPDNREKIQQNGENESCLGVLNNFYGDGIKWHDVTCHHEKPIVCEDVEGHIAFARQNFPNLRIP
ncbi:uncharacterized protein [Lepeophtheirus salmonis]|uniref:uncharacterized protein isoform X2 n=1 Tax=Lepeophtheirus salmonis TaxID=72036 RepID=UPI001AE7E3EC|nr:uncharacterized protein LOC121123935 isoform X2 [Lepeophtheirus salmonis]